MATRDADTNPTGESRDPQRQQEQQPMAEQDKQSNPGPGIKDKDAETSDSYGKTRESGEGR